MSRHHAKKKTGFLLSACASLLILSACQTTQEQTLQKSREARIDSALGRAAASVEARGQSSQSLPFLEQSYKRNSDDENAAIAYAAALRRTDQLNRASIVLQPFANSAASTTNAKSEYAAIQLAQGNYTAAEDFAQKAIIQDDKNFEAYHYLGIALDARSMHKEAERSFRKGLELWEGDPTTIMNNLALNLTSQGYLDEAATILQKAQSISPDRVELERNLRIVNALRESGGYSAPKPSAKPSAFGPQPQ